jgi:hypothetical protein
MSTISVDVPQSLRSRTSGPWVDVSSESITLDLDGAPLAEATVKGTATSTGNPTT